jgi:hypothetical protein
VKTNGVAWDERLRAWVIVYKRAKRKRVHQHAVGLVSEAISLYNKLADGDDCPACKKRRAM